MKRMRLILAGLSLLALMLPGCGDHTAAPPSTQPRSTAPATQAAAVPPLAKPGPVGTWKAVRSDVATPELREQMKGMLADLEQEMLWFKEDGSYRSYNPMTGASAGTWTREGPRLTLHPEGRPGGMRRPEPSMLTFAADQIVRNLGESVQIIFQRQPQDPGARRQLTAEQLLAEVKQDAAAAEKTYKGKLTAVELTGLVGMVTTQYGDPLFTLIPPPAEGTFKPPTSLLEGIICAPIAREPWATLAPGQRIKVAGYAVVTPWGVNLVEAEVLEAGPTTAIAVSAEALGGAVAADLAATTDKYKDKTLIVTGIVLSKAMAEEPFILTLGPEARQVVCKLGNPGEKEYWTPQLEKLKVGDTAKVFGQFGSAADKSVILWHCQLITK